jgi:hypothetical protein
MGNTLEFIVKNEKGELNEKKVISDVSKYPNIIKNLKVWMESPIIEREKFHEYSNVLKTFPHFYKEITKPKK